MFNKFTLAEKNHVTIIHKSHLKTTDTQENVSRSVVVARPLKM